MIPVGEADEPAYLQQLSLICHPLTNQERFFGMMSVAYCDESEDTQGQRVYVVAGLLGTLPDFTDLSRRWQAVLTEENISEFHMAKCECGDGPFRGMNRDRRVWLQRRFIDLIVDAKVWGHASAIELGRYNEIIEKIRAKRGVHAKPYYLAFQHTVEMMALELEDHHWPKSECIAFVFDQHQEYQGHAKALYDSITNADTRSMFAGDPLPYAHRLGSLTFDSRRRSLPLQAADIWTYENLRFIRDVKLGGQSRRWQWERLMETGRMNGRVFTPKEIDHVAALEGWE
jgi:hypothetical protein